MLKRNLFDEAARVLECPFHAARHSSTLGLDLWVLCCLSFGPKK
jgi:hypothetical protein